MKRTSVNPWDWGLKWSMDQGEMVEGVTLYLHCSGQVAVAPAPETELGISVLHPGEIRGQMQVALDNVDAVLTAAMPTRNKSLSKKFMGPTSAAGTPPSCSSRFLSSNSQMAEAEGRFWR